MTGAKHGAGSDYPSGTPEITPVFSGGRFAQSIYGVFCVLVFVFVSMALSVYLLTNEFGCLWYPLPLFL